jgi:hypothetical protein
MRALPGEAVIEDQHFIGSALPFPNQPGSGLRLGTSAQPRLSGLLELLCILAEPALLRRAQAAESDFLHPVCDGSHQQRAAQVQRCIRFRRFGAKPDKKIVDRQAASPSSWKTPFIATSLAW